MKTRARIFLVAMLSTGLLMTAAPAAHAGPVSYLLGGVPLVGPIVNGVVAGIPVVGPLVSTL